MSAPDPANPADHLKSYRWRKGQSGNPGGRPRGSSMKKVLGRVMRQKHNGKSYYDLLGEVLCREALKGKHPFVKELLDRLEGPVPRPGEAAADGGEGRVVVFNIVEAVPPPRPPPRPPPQFPGDGRENVRVVGE